jgi:hypothetical protein
MLSIFALRDTPQTLARFLLLPSDTRTVSRGALSNPRRKAFALRFGKTALRPKANSTVPLLYYVRYLLG